MKQSFLPIYNIHQFSFPIKEKDIYVEKVSEHLKKFKYVLEPHKHDFYFVVLCLKGSGTHTIDFIDYEIKPGYLFVMHPAQTHSLKLSEDAEGIVLMHSRDFYDLNFTSQKVKDFPFYCSMQNSPLIKLKEIKKVETHLLELMNEYKGEDRMKYQKMACVINILYIELIRIYLPDKPIEIKHQSYMVKIRQLEDLIDTHFRTLKTPSDYSQLMNVTEKHLNKICKESLNKTTSDMISDRIILEAKRLLVYGDRTGSEVSGELGYFDNSYFSRLFKKKTGETPLEFIKKYHLKIKR
ncbi:MAG: AraC family transcriptional regulator [Bacteroidia bacterium]